jgi:hypothetical protein
MARPGGIMLVLQQSISARFDVIPRENLIVPATERDLTPQAARAVE